MRRVWIASAVVLIAVMSPILQAQTVVRWTAKVEPVVKVQAGGTFEVTLDARIDPGWHLYALTQEGGGPQPLVIVIPPESPFRLDGNPIANLPAESAGQIDAGHGALAIGEPGLEGLGEYRFDLLLVQLAFELHQELVHHAQDDFGIEGGKGYRRVQAVAELRRKRALDFGHFVACLPGGSETHGGLL